MNSSALSHEILSSFEDDGFFHIIQSFEFSTSLENQLLLFIKPEVFLVGDVSRSREVCELVLDKLGEFGVEVAGIARITGAALEQQGTMARHYGYINQMSTAASKLLSNADRHKIANQLNMAPTASVFGGHEALAEFDKLDAAGLDRLWATKGSIRLRGGLYFQRYDICDRDVVIVNGFHPFQLEHYTANDRSIVLMLLHSATPWRILRQEMLGDAFPEKAEHGSIRETLYAKAQSFGFSEVTIANNCVHLSAGPYESMFELANFLSIMPEFDLSRTNVAMQMVGNAMEFALVQESLNNPTSSKKGSENQTLFDLTEEMDTHAAVRLFREIFADSSGRKV